MRWHHSNSYATHPTDPDLVEVDYLYCFQWDDFTDQHWQLLADIYPRLPGTKNGQILDLWFDVNEQPPYLSASVEPPGLQVGGTLKRTDWHHWDQAFRAEVEAAALPIYEP